MEQTANTMPAAALGQYKGLAFTRRVRPVSDKAVEADIGNLARVHAPFVPTDAPAARGMRVTLDFEGFLEGAPIPDSRMEKVTVVLGTGQLMPAAEEAVYGHCAGETFRFDFTYPAEFRVPELSGKTAQFEICLHTVERKQVPPVDDALAKSLGFADLDALRESLREKKRLSHEANADRIAGAALLDMAGANLTVELPAELLAQNAEYQMTQLRQRLRKSQMTMELYCKSAGLTPEQVREGYRSHKLKPYRAAAKAEKAAFKANVDFQYHKALHDNPQIAGNPLSRFMQKQQIKRQYAKSARKGGAKTAQKAAENTRKAAKKTAEETKKAIAFVGRHPAGVCIAVAALLLFIMVSAGLSSCGSMFSGLMNGILGTSYTSEDSDLVATENNYAAKENELQQQIDNIESTHPGYDEYRYDLDSIGHNPHELASYLTALLQTYTPQSAQAELNRVFAMQYTLTLTEETEIRYRTETSTDPETGETTTEEVPYEYHILNVKLTNKPISEIAEELLTPQQLEMYRVYLETSGNKPLIFGGGSPDMGASEDLSGVQLVNGTRPGNTAVVDLAKRQVGNVGGRPFWSWYGFNSRVEWCACFVSWCYNQAGKSEPRFAGCQSQGVPWFQSRGQWGARGYENIAPGDAIFFDWDGDGSADHVGLVIGTDGERVYTVEGNSGDACKIKSYPVNYSCIKGYGLMNWN